MAGRIFINYRRDDSAAHALNIAQYLEKEFCSESVFIDIDRLRPGEKFPHVLAKHLQQCEVMIAVIGPNWLTQLDPGGNRRIDNPEDWVRLEIQQALERDICVIPVTVNGAALPSKTELPTDISALVDRQAVNVTTRGFRHELAGLTRDIRARRISPLNIRQVFAGIAAVLILTTVYFGYPRNSDKVQSGAQPVALIEPEPLAKEPTKVVWTTSGPVIDPSGDWGLRLNEVYLAEFGEPKSEAWWLGVVLKTSKPFQLGLAPRPSPNGGLSDWREAVELAFPATISQRIVVGSVVWVAPDDATKPEGTWSFKAFPTRK